MVAGDAPGFETAIEQLRQRLGSGLPGRDAMGEMAPTSRRFTSAGEALSAGASLAGAMVLLFPGERRRAHLPLTLRQPGLSRHAGQVSLPGGRLEPGESPERAAVRELAEELGVMPPDLALLGRLSPLYIAPSDFVLQPVVGACSGRPEYQPDAGEVAAVLEVAVDDLVGDRCRRWEWRSDERGTRRVPYFDLAMHKVWGATAMVLAELAALWPDTRRENPQRRQS